MTASKRPWVLDGNYIHPVGEKISIAEVYDSKNYAPSKEYEIPSIE